MQKLIFKKELSLKEKGLISIFDACGVPVCLADLVNISKDGEYTTRITLNQLIQYKYVKKNVLRDRGKISEIKYELMVCADGC